MLLDVCAHANHWRFTILVEVPCHVYTGNSEVMHAGGAWNPWTCSPVGKGVSTDIFANVVCVYAVRSP